MPAERHPHHSVEALVRTYAACDHHAVSHLYIEGLLAGHIAPNDTGADIENMTEAYFSSEGSHFWVAEVDGRVVGMIGVAREDNHTVEIRRLRVAPEFQDSGIAQQLVETAVAHCQLLGAMKVVLDTRFQTQQALGLFEKFGFLHTRTRSMQEGKETLEFYLNLYQSPKRDHEHHHGHAADHHQGHAHGHSHGQEHHHGHHEPQG